MASMNVEYLFTNVPASETIFIITIDENNGNLCNK